MAEIGKRNQLEVVKTVNFGVYLDAQEFGEILLPKRYVPKNCKPGMTLDVFIYADSNDELIATTEVAKASVGQCAYLKVKDQSKVGVFMDWGLSKDLLVPYNEQAYPMQVGRSYVVYVYLDKTSNRIAASTNLHFHLNENGQDFEPGQAVDLMIAAQTSLGYKAIINNSHLGLIYQADVFRVLRFGQTLRGYIKSIREDGKINLTLQLANDDSRDELEEKILLFLRAMGGMSKITDKSPPELIYKTFETSKANYKRALGRLYKQKKILIEKQQITLL